jgi:hypothetical protein
VAKYIPVTRLDYADACELVAFVETIGWPAARHVFGWVPNAKRHYERLRDHLKGFGHVQAMVEQNVAEPTREDGLAVLRAMQDGGWKQGWVPPIVRLAVLDMRDAGMSQPKIAKALGLTRDQVVVMCTGRRDLRQKWRNTALLAVG